MITQQKQCQEKKRVELGLYQVCLILRGFYIHAALFSLTTAPVMVLVNFSDIRDPLHPQHFIHCRVDFCCWLALVTIGNWSAWNRLALVGMGFIFDLKLR